jgi:hypothetical protein
MSRAASPVLECRLRPICRVKQVPNVRVGAGRSIDVDRTGAACTAVPVTPPASSIGGHQHGQPARRVRLPISSVDDTVVDTPEPAALRREGGCRFHRRRPRPPRLPPLRTRPLLRPASSRQVARFLENCPCCPRAPCRRRGRRMSRRQHHDRCFYKRDAVRIVGGKAHRCDVSGHAEHMSRDIVFMLGVVVGRV